VHRSKEFSEHSQSPAARATWGGHNPVPSPARGARGRVQAGPCPGRARRCWCPRRVVGALALWRFAVGFALGFAGRSARASHPPLSPPRPSAVRETACTPLTPQAHGVPRTPWLSHLVLSQGTGTRAAPPDNARTPTRPCPRASISPFCFPAHTQGWVGAAQPLAVGRCSGPRSRGGRPLSPRCTRCCQGPPHPTAAASSGARLPAEAAAGGRDRWCPRRHTCLGFILAPNSHYFTRQPATHRRHPHAANLGGVIKNTPNPRKPSAAVPPRRPPSSAGGSKVTSAREAASPRVPGQAPPAPPAAAARLRGVEIRGVLWNPACSPPANAPSQLPTRCQSSRFGYIYCSPSFPAITRFSWICCFLFFWFVFFLNTWWVWRPQRPRSSRILCSTSLE